MREIRFNVVTQRALVAAAVAAVLAGFQAPAQAQTAGTAASTDTSAPEETLETVVVSAERREERLQDVPETITNISSDDLAKNGITDLGDIPTVTPGLRFDYAGNFAQPTIRGVGTVLAVSGSGSNVGIYVDGFYSPNPEANDFQLLNVDSIQVLKGPQGTLFGRNTTGGAILINTSKPSQDTQAIADVSYGNFNAQKYQAYFTTGLTSNLSFDVSGMFTKGDGWVHNIADNSSDAGAYQDYSMRAGLLFTPTDDLSFLFRYSHTGTHDPSNLTGSVFYIKGVPQTLAYQGGAYPYATMQNQVAYDDEPVVFLMHSNTYQLTGTYDFGAGTLTSYTQYKEERGETYESLDYVPVRFLNINIHVNDKTFTQELLAASKPGTRLQWTGGVFFSNTTDAWPTSAQLFGGPFAPNAGSSTTFRSLAGYADLTYEIIPSKLFLTGGFRYTHDEESDGYYYSIATPGLLEYPTLTSNRGTPRAVLRYQFTSDANVYASYSKGFKSAIYNVGGGQTNPINPETLSAYELGVKYAAHGISADAAYYYYDYKDLQVENYATINNVALSLISNAANATIWGFDGDLKYSGIVPGLDASMGANYTHATYGTFLGAPALTTCSAAPCAFNNIAVDASGFAMPRAPRFTGNVGLVYSMPLADGKLALSGNYYYTTAFYFDPGNQYRQGGYGTLGTRAEWTTPSGQWTFSLWGDNVTNKRYYTQVLGNFPGVGGDWNAPALYGVEAKFRLH